MKPRAGNGPSMFLRMLVRASVVRRGRASAALVAVVVAAATATTMLNLYTDVGAKLHREFRSYGANIVVAGRDRQALPPGTLATIDRTLAGRGIAVPFAYAVARRSDDSSIIAAGTDFAKVQRLNRWWAVTGWPSAPNQALLGKRAAAVLSPTGAPFDLSFSGKTLHLASAGTLTTGAAEDSRVYLSLPEFEAWTNLQPSTVEIAAAGSAEEVGAVIQNLRQSLPDLQVQPVRQIVEAEGRVLGKTQSSLLAAAALIVLTAMLCVLSTLTGWVLDRRRDFAIMKAIGASERLIAGFFAAEAAALGAVGAVIGYLIGIGVAAWIGRVDFHSAVTPRFSVLPVVFIGSIAVALLASLLPMALLRRVQPAMILRGE